MENFKGFDTWADVIAFVKADFGTLYYNAPLDHWPRIVDTQLSKNERRVKVTPMSNQVDPFWADAGHLDRFKRRVD